MLSLWIHAYCLISPQSICEQPRPEQERKRRTSIISDIEHPVQSLLHEFFQSEGGIAKQYPLHITSRSPLGWDVANTDKP